MYDNFLNPQNILTNKLQILFLWGEPRQANLQNPDCFRRPTSQPHNNILY